MTDDTTYAALWNMLKSWESEECLSSEQVEKAMLLAGQLEIPDRILLTFAAEAVALVTEPSQALFSTCIALLGHEAAYVREGAVYGLSPHVTNVTVSNALRRVAENDEDDIMRAIAGDALDLDP